MRDLDLVGLSADERHLLLSDDTGEDFRVRVDDRLRAVLGASLDAPPGGERVRPRQVEKSMDSALRPRDIQSRIRAGESPEAVAAVAEMSLERVMAYAVPVLAEREHVWAQARRSGLRRKHASGPSRLLGQVVDDHLRSNGWDPEEAIWDSWRRDDGRWSVTVAASRSGEPATFLFDVPGRYVVAHDDGARRLVGDEPPLSVEPETDEPRRSMPPMTVASTARGSALPTAQQPVDMSELSADLAALEAEVAAQAHADASAPPDAGRAAALDAGRDAADAPTGDEPPAPSGDDDMEAIARVMAVPEQEPLIAVGQNGESDPPPANEGDGQPKKRRSSRRAVPSWDEIMFGSKPQS
jgi:hypothetical protein